jgi:hypothetical protein
LEHALELIDKLTKLPAAVESLSWWCHTTPESTLKLGCPHGYGGLPNRYGEGSYSECVQYPDFDVLESLDLKNMHSMTPEIFAETCNQQVIDYLLNVLPNEGFFSSCLCAGIWIVVPDDWRRKYYLVEE